MTMLQGMPASPRLGSISARATVFAALWWVLAEGSNAGWLLGAVATLLATWTSLVLLPPGTAAVRPFGLARFLAFFAWHSLRGGWQVAAMALRGRAGLQPALLEIPVMLPPGGARVLLTSALGLMPGTLSVDMAADTLRVHVLDGRLPVLAETRALESAIGRLYQRAT